MNEEIAYAEDAIAEGQNLSPRSSTDGSSQSDEPFSLEADARGISDARFYLVAMGAFFSAPSPCLPEEKEGTLRPGDEW